MLGVIQGTGDAFITFAGGDASHDRLGLGDGGSIESADATRAFWAERAGCTPDPVVTALDPVDDEDPTRVTCTPTVGAMTARASITISSPGWAIPGLPKRGNTPCVTGPTSRQLDATALIWAFFNEGS